MSLVSPTVADLATFKGRDSNSFSTFASEALDQATLLFYLATGLENYPDDVSLARLAKYGILDMADNIYLSQPYQEALASPYQSETIGSYSYSKTVKAIKKGDATGVTWFDMAVNRLKAGGSGIGDSGSIEGMEWDGIAPGPNGKNKIVGASGTYGPRGREAWAYDNTGFELYNIQE
jgi:hypothetical protein